MRSRWSLVGRPMVSERSLVGGWWAETDRQFADAKASDLAPDRAVGGAGA